jgi:predicted RNA-binding protein with PUA-like domain
MDYHAMDMAHYWLMKSEPSVFSIDDLARAKGQTTRWDGVRNFQARNFLRDQIAVGDGVLFYHSSADPPAVAGTATVVRAGYPDPTQFDRGDSHHDPDSSPDDPRWYAVDIKFDSKFKQPVTLPELRTTPTLADMVLLRRGSRLSVQPVSPAEWKLIGQMGNGKPSKRG